MLAEKMLESLNKLISVSNGECDKKIPIEISKIESFAQKRGKLTSGFTSSQIKKFFQSELEKRAKFIYKNIIRIHDTFGTILSDDIADDLKKELKLKICDTANKLLVIMNSYLTKYGSNDAFALERLSIDLSNKYELEIDLYIESLQQAIQIHQNENEEKKMTNIPLKSNEIWKIIKEDYDVTKRGFGRKIHFVDDEFKRKVIFRDIEHAFALSSLGYSKPAVILAGGVIEELLRLYLEYNNITPPNRTLNGYITSCENNRLLKKGVSRLSDSVRHFRNLVHLSNEREKRSTISKATAKGAFAALFTITNDF